MMLHGMRVLDLTQNVAGPYCTMLLGDLGADVIKVERPGTGDDTRAWIPEWDGNSTTFLALNRNKRSLAIDVKHPVSREPLLRLIRQADILVQSFRPGALDRLGYGYDDVRRENQRLIYCSLGTYGNEGPMAGMPAYDPLMQAYAGLMSITGANGGEPVRVGTSILDMGMGMWGVIGILGALLERQTTGTGQHVRTSLYETAIGWVPYQIAAFLATKEVPQRWGSGVAMLAPYQAYPTADGHILIAAGNDGLWRRLCGALRLAGAADDPRFVTNAQRVAHRDELAAVLIETLCSDTTAAWVKTLGDAGVPCAPIRTIDAIVDDPQTQAIQMLRSVPHPAIADYVDVGIPTTWNGERPATRTSPPALGEGTQEVLTELGYTAEEIEHFRKSGAVAAQD